MSLHDTYARLTPFELTFPDLDDATELLHGIEAEADDTGADPGDLQQFVTMGHVAELVARLAGPDTPPEAVPSVGLLAYHAVHFERAGRPLFLLSTHAARLLVDGAPSGAPRPTTTAGYLQLPQHLFWAEPTPGGVESVDGIFWAVSASGHLRCLVVTGIRDDRPGLGVVPVPEAPLDDARRWIRTDVREGAEDFSAKLPGSELDRLHAFQAAGEVLKLLGRFFAFASSVPSALTPGAPEPGVGPPRPSALPYTRVGLG